MTRGASPALALVLALPFALGSLASCGRDSEANESATLARRANDPWTGSEIADFTLTERSGREVTLDSLRGRPFVIDFVFTTCSGPCPKLSSNMQRLQTELEGTDVRLVSVTVDPAVDDAATLRDYAERFHADPERWLFLTGDEDAIHELARSVLLAVERAPDAPKGTQVTHATRLVVADREGVVRGYYDGLTDGGLAAAAARARYLSQEQR